MKPDFTDRIAKIIAEFRTRTYIDGIDAKAISEILQDELNEYHNEVFMYARNIGYDDGYADGKSSLDEAAERAYYEGYYEGYDDGYERRVCRLSRVFHGFQDDRDADFNRSK